MAKLTIGNLTINGLSGIPTLDVMVDGERFGYLSPFRGYFFQVSRSYDGEYTLGRSIDTGETLRNVLTKRPYLYDVQLIKQLAYSALMDSASMYRELEYRYKGNIIDVNVELPSINSEFNRFIDESIKWVKGL